jgi:outer membrane protein OmpA-like peptidoglycan-associated protein
MLVMRPSAWSRCGAAVAACLAIVLSSCDRAEPAEQQRSEPAVQLGSEPEGLPRAADVELASTEDSESVEPDSVVTGIPCEEVAGATAEIAEQEQATIPLVVGLTFDEIWHGPDSGKTDFDHECLAQVTAVDAGRVVYLSRCEVPGDSSRVRTRTQLCRSDLRDGSIYRTQIGPNIPDLVAGSTMHLLSRRAFRELRERGETGFRQVHLLASMWQTGAEAPEPDATVYVTQDSRGPMRRTGTGTLSVQLNDSLVALPVIYAEAVLQDSKGGRPDHQRLVILDDERVPVVLDNHRTTTNGRIKFVRITWPRRASLERDLAEGRKSILYGIYFDYNSAEIRKESEVVLREIAGVLEAHPDWSLRIDGHTDSIGGAAFNQDLSVRRAEAVRTALVERYGIVAARLATGGSGASRPLDRNDTPEGRARNRRVELTRP